MINPAAYVESLLAHHLKEFVENFDEDSLQVESLWDGEIILDELHLKTFEFPVMPGINIALEYGKIREAKISIPGTWVGECTHQLTGYPPPTRNFL